MFARRLLALCLAVAVPAILSPAATADVVHLKNGNSIEGRAVDLGEKIEIQLLNGKMRLPKSDVDSIERAPSPLDEYEKRRAAVIEDDLQSWWALLKWCEENGAYAFQEDAARRILELDPEHAGAHQALGHILYEGQWMTDREAKEAQGYIFYKGAWITNEQYELIQQKKEHEKRARAFRKAVRPAIRKMASRHPEKRQEGHQEFLQLSSEHSVANGLLMANQIKGYYEHAWKLVLELERQNVIVEGALALSSLTELRQVPISTGGAGDVLLELPEMQYTQYRGTVIVPGPWKLIDWWVIFE